MTLPILARANRACSNLRQLISTCFSQFVLLAQITTFRTPLLPRLFLTRLLTQSQKSIGPKRFTHHFRKDTQMSVRDVNNCGSNKVIALFPSRHGREIWCESLLELNYVHLLDTDSDVKDFDHQPLKLEYLLDGKRRRYTPDFRVIRANGKQLIEVKPHSKAISQEWRQRFQAIALEAEKLGYEFKVITDRLINLEPQLRNVKFLRRYFRVEITLEHTLVTKRIFRDHHTVSLGLMTKGFEMTGLSIQSLYSMIYHGLLGVRLDEPFTADSQLFCQL